MPRAQPGSAPGDVTIDVHHPGTDRLEELVDLRLGPLLRRAHHHLRIDAGPDEDFLTSYEPRSQLIDRAIVLGIGCVEEGN